MNTFKRLFNHLTGRATKRLIATLEAQISAQNETFSINHLRTTEALNLMLERINTQRDFMEATGKATQALRDRIDTLETCTGQQDKAMNDLNQDILYIKSLTDTRYEDYQAFTTVIERMTSFLRDDLTKAMTRIHDLEAATHVHSQMPKDAPKRAAAQRSKEALKADQPETAECATLKPHDTPTKGFIPDTPPNEQEEHNLTTSLPNEQDSTTAFIESLKPKTPFRPVDIQIGSH